MNNNFDVLVIGSGLAGICSAAAAVQKDARVGLVSNGPGTFALGSACVNLEELQSDHFLGDNRFREKAVDFFLSLTAAAGCQYHDNKQGEKLIPTALGTYRSASLAPAAAWAGNPNDINKALVLGIKGLHDFNAGFLAETLSYEAHSLGYAAQYLSETAEIHNLPPIVTPLEIARFMDQSDFKQKFVNLVKPLVSGYDQIIIPGILGLDSDASDLQELQNALGCRICEIPTTPPSIPGLRVYHHLVKYLQNSGVKILSGYPVTSIKIAPEQETEVLVNNPGRPRMLHAGSLVLATGRGDDFPINIGSGLTIGPRVKVNQKLQPLDTNDSLLADNFFAAGSIIANDTACIGNARAILTGYLAGSQAGKGEGN